MDLNFSEADERFRAEMREALRGLGDEQGALLVLDFERLLYAACATRGGGGRE